MPPAMSTAEFSRLAEEWARAITLRAVDLFKDGVDVNDCLKIAISIHDSQVRARREPASAIVRAQQLPPLN